MTVIEALSNLELQTLAGQTPQSLKAIYLNLANLIRESGNSLDEIHHQYSLISDKLTEALKLELSQLDERRNIPWWKIMIGVNPMTQVTYNQQYNQIITHYNKILEQANNQFITQLLETYKTANSELVEILFNV